MSLYLIFFLKIFIIYKLVCYAFGPMIAGLILHYIGFKGLGIIIGSMILLFIPMTFFLKRIYLSKHLAETVKKAQY